MTRKMLLALSLALAAAVAYGIYRYASKEEIPPYRFAGVERSNLESAVSATGTLGAVTTVQVGTQVSGQIAAISVDFNDKVKKGQLIARIDPILQQQAVQDAQASIDRSRAELDKSRLEYERNKRLFEQKVLTEIEFNTAKYAYEVAQAGVKSAQINLQRARQNLDYTSIYAPIDGIVVERNVDVGQTVAASYSTPQLFLIAKDLSQMQILASVDESDIGLIKNGQPVRFTVQAYPNQDFEGKVQQVRLQSKTTENVVNYTVVVAVQNVTGKLLPGMTATVEFLTGSAANVLTVPNTALRFRPPEAMLAKLREDAQKKRSGKAGETSAAAPRTYAPHPGRNGNGARPPANVGTLWYLDAQGKPTVARVRTGISDGQRTAVEGREIKEGMQVIIGTTQVDASGNSSILQMGRPPQQQQQQRGPGRRSGGL